MNPTYCPHGGHLLTGRDGNKINKKITLHIKWEVLQGKLRKVDCVTRSGWIFSRWLGKRPEKSVYQVIILCMHVCIHAHMVHMDAVVTHLLWSGKVHLAWVSMSLWALIWIASYTSTVWFEKPNRLPPISFRQRRLLMAFPVPNSQFSFFSYELKLRISNLSVYWVWDDHTNLHFW